MKILTDRKLLLFILAVLIGIILLIIGINEDMHLIRLEGSDL